MAASGLTRRTFVGTSLAAAGSALAAACAPASAPIQAPAQPAAAAKAAWETEWDNLVSAAKREGKLRVLTLVGSGYRKGVEAFERAFPGIQVELESFTTASLWIPKVVAEREAGIYNWDVLQTPPQSVLISFRPTGGLDPIRPHIFRPDVTDNKAWRDGFESGFADKDKSLAYLMSAELAPRIFVDANQVNPGELKSIKDFLDPKWKGKILWSDVRTGATYPIMLAIRNAVGDDVVKRLMVDQQPAFSRDARQIVEALVRGRYAAGTWVGASLLQEFQEKGLGKNVVPADFPDAGVVGSNGALCLVNRAPHPSAAKLFINWVLSKEGQTAWTIPNGWNSRRADVEPGDKGALPRPDWKYVYTYREDSLPAQEETRKWLETLVQ